jgi:hypothetical protein
MTVDQLLSSTSTFANDDGHLNIHTIAQRLDVAAINLANYCTALTDEKFFYQPAGKWSAAQQVSHLIISTKMAKLPFILPKPLVRWIGGKPNRGSIPYNELVEKYQSKLAQGGKASGRYIPKPVASNYGKQRLLTDFTTAMHQLGLSLRKRWNDQQPDQYIVSHPLLGKITLRELCYFTIHHAEHHLGTIKSLMFKV